MELSKTSTTVTKAVMQTWCSDVSAGVVQQLSQRLFAALALREKEAIAAAAAGSPLQATAVHATAFRLADERIADLLRPVKPPFEGTHPVRFNGSLATSPCSKSPAHFLDCSKAVKATRGLHGSQICAVAPQQGC